MAQQAVPLSVPPPAASNWDLKPEEWSWLKKRRKDVREYNPPKWVSNHVDVVSGQHIEQSMVDHASILHSTNGRTGSLLPLIRGASGINWFPHGIPIHTAFRIDPIHTVVVSFKRACLLFVVKKTNSLVEGEMLGGGPFVRPLTEMPSLTGDK